MDKRVDAVVSTTSVRQRDIYGLHDGSSSTLVVPLWESTGDDQVIAHETIPVRSHTVVEVEATGDSPPTDRDEVVTLNDRETPGHQNTACIEHSDLLRDLGGAAAEFLTQQRKSKASREGALLLRNRVDYMRREYHEKRRFVLEDLHGVVSLLDEIRDDDDFMHKMSLLQSRLPALREDQTTLDKQAEAISKLEEELSATEYIMQERENSLYIASERTIQTLERLEVEIEEVATTPNSVQGPPSERAVSPDFHPTLQNYYDKVGEVKVLHSRLVDFENEYRESLVQRKLDQDQEKPLQQTDDVLEASYQRDKAQRESWLKHAVTAAETALEACRDQGINIDEWKQNVQDYADQDAVLSDDAAHEDTYVMSTVPEELRMAYARRESFPTEQYEGETAVQSSFHEPIKVQEGYVLAPVEDGPFVTALASKPKLDHDGDREQHHRQRIHEWIDRTGAEDASQMPATDIWQPWDPPPYERGQVVPSGHARYDMEPPDARFHPNHDLALVMSDTFTRDRRPSKGHRLSADMLPATPPGYV